MLHGPAPNVPLNIPPLPLASPQVVQDSEGGGAQAPRCPYAMVSLQLLQALHRCRRPAGSQRRGGELATPLHASLVAPCPALRTAVNPSVQTRLDPCCPLFPPAGLPSLPYMRLEPTWHPGC